MMKISRSYTCGVLAVFIYMCASCSKADKAWTSVDIVRLDSLALAYRSNPALQMPDSVDKCAAALLQYLALEHHDTTWQAYTSSRAVAVFAPEAAKAFPSLTPLRDTVGMMLDNADRVGLALLCRHFATTVWSGPKSIVVNEPYIFIALNHYLGSDHPAYEGWPWYIRAVKTSQMLPYDIAETLIAEAYPYSVLPPSKRTVLSRMLYEGALAYAKTKVVPEAKPYLALGYDMATMEDVRSNEAFIWRHLVEGQMLFSTDAALADKLFAPAPSTPVISPDAPGRVARFIGLRIIEKFIEKNPETTIAELLSPDFFGAENALDRAGYAPV